MYHHIILIVVSSLYVPIPVHCSNKIKNYFSFLSSSVTNGIVIFKSHLRDPILKNENDHVTLMNTDNGSPTAEQLSSKTK